MGPASGMALHAHQSGALTVPATDMNLCKVVRILADAHIASSSADTHAAASNIGSGLVG